ncbi:TIGR03857 family LLM class F420-dependent oxidoreductase [Streptomyces sp. NPDC001255]|uniref:TIGR03857 family LLM class F420-dependent oxidoreductase n=1 Tax=Streptomyces sp. NPDC001255 TaxID=3364550 RepID=UPI00368628C9
MERLREAVIDARSHQDKPGGLGCYVLPGGVSDPRAGLDQARAAERAGMDAVWIGERYDTKDLPSLAGALSQVTSRVRIGAAVTHTGLRHPMVLASMGQTLQALSGGRFVLGLGRSANWRWDAYGVPAPTLRTLADSASILRRLWAGETVSYEGPAGRFPSLRLPQRIEGEAPPLLLAAVGPRTLDVAGESYDGVILHPFLTVEGVQASVRRVREAAARAGRDPGRVRVAAAVVVAPDATPAEEDLAIRARAAGYFSVRGLGDALVRANGWAEGDLAAYRAQPSLTALGDLPADKHLGREELAALCAGMPAHWIASSSALGDTEACARRLAEYRAAGADELILHGMVGERVAPLAARYAGVRGGR